MSAEGRDLAPFVPPARLGLQSRVWREITRFVFRYMANPALPAEVRRRRMDRFVGIVRVSRGTRVERVMAGRRPPPGVVPPRGGTHPAPPLLPRRRGAAGCLLAPPPRGGGGGPLAARAGAA